jgi:exopolyphosphatase/guanosine-5'-triphosphate,3'-diphosphate pyrophosphatase
MKLAAIDIGSNAIRLLLCQVLENEPTPVFKKIELVRVPIRLGEDVFTQNYISKEKAERLVKAMKAFRHLIDVFECIGYKACATSAMRDSENGKEIIARVKKEADINIEIIDGHTEAKIIYSNHVAEELSNDFNYLYIDVGGGSTELTLFGEDSIIASRSFNIGTIRLLHDKVTKENWDELKNWIQQHCHHGKPIQAIGSGGNINKINKMSSSKDKKTISAKKIKEISDYIAEFSYEERISKLGLNEDRADVIIPAAKIFLTAMKHAGIDRINVPQLGLSDGLVHVLYEKIQKEKKGIFVEG